MRVRAPHIRARRAKQLLLTELLLRILPVPARPDVDLKRPAQTIRRAAPPSRRSCAHPPLSTSAPVPRRSICHLAAPTQNGSSVRPTASALDTLLYLLTLASST